MSLILYISIGKIQKFTIYIGNSNQSGQIIKKRRSALIYRNTFWGNLKNKKCLFPIYKKKKHLQVNTQILGKA